MKRVLLSRDMDETFSLCFVITVYNFVCKAEHNDVSDEDHKS